MCFSPEASFIASGGLATISTASLAVAPKNKRILVAIPFAFAIQQGIEGIQWLFLRAGSVSVSAAYGFLFFALLLWPIAIPLLVYRLDKETRHISRWFLGAGVALSLYFLAALFLNGVDVVQMNRSIQYLFYSFPGGGWFVMGILYIVIVAVPALLSSIPFLRLLALTGILSAVVAYYFFAVTFVSVWCFFAASLSSMVFAYLYLEKKKVD